MSRGARHLAGVRWSESGAVAYPPQTHPLGSYGVFVGFWTFLDLFWPFLKSFSSAFPEVPSWAHPDLGFPAEVG